MALTMLTSYKEVFHAFGLLSLFLLIQKGNAYEFKVGGSTGWAVPSDSNVNSYKQWAERNRFQIGDTLLFVYPADKDSVLYVTKEDFTSCNTEAPLEKYTDGHTVFQFNHSGPYYFISGVKDNCLKNEKLTVVVLADRSTRNSSSHQTVDTPPPPSNETVVSPPPAPSAEVPPSPAPTGEEAPSTPNPTSAPSQETPPPSGASSIVMSFIGSIGAFIGSSLLLVL